MISSLHPWALTGILAVGIPIAIHLIRERRKIAVVPSLLLFTNMKRITSRRKLENLFLLILRCLVILLITLFLAGPYLRKQADASSTGKAAQGITLGILLDDSPFSEASIQGRRAFDLMKENTLKRIGGLSPDSTVLIASAAAGAVSAPLTPHAAVEILKKMQPQPHQGNLAHAAAELGKTLLSVKGTFYATILIEALPFVNTWRSFDVKSTGLPPSLFHTDSQLMDTPPDPFIESAQRTERGSGIQLTLGGNDTPLPPNLELEISSADSGTEQKLPLQSGLHLKNTVTVQPSGFRKDEALQLTLLEKGKSCGALSRWFLGSDGNQETSSVLLLHDGTQETAHAVLMFHAALTLADAKLTVQAINLQNPQAFADLKNIPACIIVPSMKRIPAEILRKLSELLASGSNLMFFAQNHVPELPGLAPALRMEWREPIRSGAGFDLTVAENSTARNLFFRIYAKGLSAVRLKELAAFRTASPDTEILHHASMPVLSIRPVAGGGSLILWGVPTHPLPLALTAVPVFPELLRQTVFAGSTGHGGTLFAGNVMDPAEVLGTASASGELRYPDDLFPRSRFQWTPSQPVEIYLPLAGFNTFELLIPGRHPERKNLAVNLKRQTGGLLSQKERERLPQTAPPGAPLKVSTLTSDGSGGVTVTDGEVLKETLYAQIILALTLILVLETVFSMLGSRRRKETEQC